MLSTLLKDHAYSTFTQFRGKPVRLVHGPILSKSSDSSKPGAVHTEFTRDFDRVIFSTAFRRLQDKTQVFPLAKSDYVRTRLTHSLEVASVGRSLGVLAGEAILNRDSLLKNVVDASDMGMVVASACLAHDIGNPPFGHAGEAAIQEWVERYSDVDKLSSVEREDLLKFEGNAQGFRTLVFLQQHPQPGGLRLTAATLGAFTKYPRESVVDPAQAQGISGKKFGFMLSEAEQFDELAGELGLLQKAGAKRAWHRHPLAFLVEAADDICYHVMDVEDGFKAGCLTFEELDALFKPWLDSTSLRKAEKIQDKHRRVEYFRAASINTMIAKVTQAFMDNYEGLMDGSFDKSLTEQMSLAGEFKDFKDLAVEKVYRSRPVLEIEACGFEVVGGLLDAFTMALRSKAEKSEKGRVRSRTLLNLMPSSGVEIVGLGRYKQLQLATDFVSGMTDSFAVELYQRIRGISLP